MSELTFTEREYDFPQPTLDPCPFCAGPAYLATYHDGLWFVECNACGASGLSVDDKDEAIARWQKRQHKVCDHAMRLKLDQRIHNQRVALRENWMITEQRSHFRNRSNRQVSRDLVRLMDEVGIERDSGSGGQWSFWYRFKMFKEKCLAALAGVNEQS